MLFWNCILVSRCSIAMQLIIKLVKNKSKQVKLTYWLQFMENCQEHSLCAMVLLNHHSLSVEEVFQQILHLSIPCMNTIHTNNSGTTWLHKDRLGSLIHPAQEHPVLFISSLGDSHHPTARWAIHDAGVVWMVHRNWAGLSRCLEVLNCIKLTYSLDLLG